MGADTARSAVRPVTARRAAADAGGSSGALLDGVVVLEATDTPAAAFAGALAGDFGATVIACEPGAGSGLRRLGPTAVQRVWWPIIGRNKRSLMIAGSHPAAAPLLARLAAGADMLLRDGSDTGERLRQAMGDSPHAVDVHLFPTGADRPDLWPWSIEPEFAAAACGLMALTGRVDGPATQPEMPLADYCAGMLALSVALAELRAARADGSVPQPVAMALHEALHRMNEWQLVVATQRGTAETRNGNRFPMNANIGNVFRTRDGQLLTVSAATPSVADRLLVMIGGTVLRDDPRFRTPEDRRRNMDALDAVVADWIGRHDAADAMRIVRENDVVVGPICGADAVRRHGHIKARGDVVDLTLPGHPPMPMPAALPFIEPAGIMPVRAGPALGADTDSVLAEFGLEPEEIRELRSRGVIGP